MSPNKDKPKSSQTGHEVQWTQSFPRPRVELYGKALFQWFSLKYDLYVWNRGTLSANCNGLSTQHFFYDLLGSPSSHFSTPYTSCPEKPDIGSQVRRRHPFAACSSLCWKAQQLVQGYGECEVMCNQLKLAMSTQCSRNLAPIIS